MRMNDLPEWEFHAWYGAFAPWSPDRVARLLGDRFPWWLCGGWAIDAFTGTAREHSDVDVGVFAAALPAVREWLAEHELRAWVARDGALVPVPPGTPDPEGAEQLWIRRDAYSPWRFELLLTQGDAASGWVSKRDGSVRPYDEATYTGADGIRYLAPELVLLMKAGLNRDKDRADLARSLPHLDAARRRRLRADLTAIHPGHAWLEDL